MPPLPLWVHTFFEVLGFMVGLWLLQNAKKTDPLSKDHRSLTLSAAIIGASVGCKLVAVLDHPDLISRLTSAWHAGQWASFLMLLSPGKGVVGGLVGGWVLVEAVKKCVGITQSSGDLMVWPLTAGLVIGRIGCLLTGLADQTYGLPTLLPWAIDFGDGIGRHPTQLYDMLWLLGCAALSTRIRAPFSVFIGGYLVFRLVIDGLKPIPHPYWGLNMTQGFAVLGCIMAVGQLIKKRFYSNYRVV